MVASFVDEFKQIVTIALWLGMLHDQARVVGRFTFEGVAAS